MQRRMVLIAVAIGLLSAGGALYAAVGTDFDMKILPAAATAYTGAAKTVNLSSTLTTRIDLVQGWSFGVKLEGDPDVTAKIVSVAKSAQVMTVKAGAKADFNTTSYFAAGDLANKVADCDPATPCSGHRCRRLHAGRRHRLRPDGQPERHDEFRDGQLHGRSAGRRRRRCESRPCGLYERCRQPARHDRRRPRRRQHRARGPGWCGDHDGEADLGPRCRVHDFDRRTRRARRTLR